MSVKLKCPNCGADIGETISKNNYEDDKGQPICKNCVSGAFWNISIVTIVIIIALIILDTIF